MAEPLQPKGETRFLTEKEGHLIVKNLVIPNHFSLPAELVRNLLTQDSVEVDFTGKRSKKKTLCKDIPRKLACPVMKSPTKVKYFIIEIGKKSKECILNTVLEEEDSQDEVSTVHNSLQNLVISTNVFKDGIFTRR